MQTCCRSLPSLKWSRQVAMDLFQPAQAVGWLRPPSQTPQLVRWPCRMQCTTCCKQTPALIRSVPRVSSPDVSSSTLISAMKTVFLSLLALRMRRKFACLGLTFPWYHQHQSLNQRSLIFRSLPLVELMVHQHLNQNAQRQP